MVWILPAASVARPDLAALPHARSCCATRTGSPDTSVAAALRSVLDASSAWVPIGQTSVQSGSTMQHVLHSSTRHALRELHADRALSCQHVVPATPDEQSHGGGTAASAAASPAASQQQRTVPARNPSAYPSLPVATAEVSHQTSPASSTSSRV